jgi:hypothetical protein
MDGYQFAAAMTGSLAWPVAAVLIAAIFHTQISGLLKRIKELAWGDKKVSFADSLDKIEAKAPDIIRLPHHGGVALIDADEPIADVRFRSLLEISPNAAILDSWSGIERSIRKLAMESGISADLTKMTAEQMAIGLRSKGHLTIEAMKMIAEMRKLRNRAAHEEQITITDALRFAELASKVERFLEH